MRNTDHTKNQEWTQIDNILPLLDYDTIHIIIIMLYGRQIYLEGKRYIAIWEMDMLYSQPVRDHDRRIFSVFIYLRVLILYLYYFLYTVYRFIISISVHNIKDTLHFIDKSYVQLTTTSPSL